MSAVPRAVAEAEARATELQEALIKARMQPQEATPPNGTPPAAAPAAPAAEPPLSNGNGLNTDPAPATAPASSQPVGQQDENSLEHRYKVLQGKYNAEVPRVAAENRELKSRLSTLEQEMEAIRNAKPQQSLIKPEEVEEYGEGLVDLARRIAQEEVMKKDQEIEALKRQLNGVAEQTQMTVREKFLASLGAAVGDWKSVNDDPNFHNWLGETDELTGRVRQDLLSEADRANDADRAANFFNAFKRTQQQQMASSNAALTSQLAPSAVTTPNAPPAKKMWSRDDIKRFYDGVRRGDISEQEQIVIEADIQAASIEGRIR